MLRSRSCALTEVMLLSLIHILADHTVSFDRLLPQDFSLRTIDKIAFGIPHEVSFKSLGTHLLVSKFDTLSPDGIGRLRVGDSH